MITFEETKECKRELKKLSKKYKTLKKDFAQLKKLYLTECPQGNGTKHWNLLYQNERIEIYKVRMHCDATKGKFFRVIYAYHIDTKTIETIEFIEIYFKGNKANEDKHRIKEYIKKYY